MYLCLVCLLYKVKLFAHEDLNISQDKQWSFDFVCLVFVYLCSSLCVCSTEKYNFLGISIVGQSNERGDGGIYIGSIMKGGAVAADGRIEPGDMLLQVSV